MTSAYSQKQIDHYLDYISFPQSLRSAPRDLNFLTVLHAYQISRIPYDNLSLHYSQSHANNIDPQVLFEKFTHNGRGGYCMETCIFYRNILRGLGFNAYTAGARIRLREGTVPYGDFIGWVHCTNIVTLPTGEKYSCDVGFGGDGPTKPLPMISGRVEHNLATQEVRLVHDYFSPTSTAPGKVANGESSPVDGLVKEDDAAPSSPKFWFYQYRNTPDQEWNTFYAFPEMEFYDPDLGIMNFWTSQSSVSFQRVRTLVVKFLMGDDVTEGEPRKIVGKLMLSDGLVKLNLAAGSTKMVGGKEWRGLNGKTQTVYECTTEGQRVRALEEVFGITLAEEQVQGIKGTVTELVG